MEKEVAEAYVQRVWDKKDLKAIDELVHPKCVIHSSLGDYNGLESMKHVVQAWLIAFPNMVVKNTAIIAERDLVAIQWQVQATHLGEFKGIKPTKKPVSYSGVTIYRISKGKIIEYWAYIDMQHLLKQLGGQ